MACNPFVEIGYKEQIEKIIGSDTQFEICSDAEREKLSIKKRKEVDQTAGGALSGPPVAYSPSMEVPIVVLMDHSGSMYKEYKDRGKRERFYWEETGFHTLLSDTIFSFSGNAKYYPMLFNSRVTYFRSSGHQTFTENSNVKGLSAADAIKKITSVNGGTLKPLPKDFYGDARVDDNTDLGMALDAAAQLIGKTPEKTGVVWLITDNRVDRGDSAEASNTRDFYKKIVEEEPQWQIAQLDPITHASWLQDSSLVVYRLLYSERELISDVEYESWIGEGSPLSYSSLNSRFSGYLSPAAKSRLGARAGIPIRMKPNNLDLIDLTFEGKPSCPTVNKDKSRNCTMDIKIENRLGHQNLSQGKFTILNNNMIAYRCADDMYSDKSNIKRCKNEEIFWQGKPIVAQKVQSKFELESEIAPIEDYSRTIQLKMPAVEVKHVSLADYWISAFTPMFAHTGFVEIDVSNLEAKTYVPKSEYSDIYGIDELPEKVENFKLDDVQQLQCMTMYTKNPNYLIAVLVVTGIAGGIVFFLGWGAFFRRRFYLVEFDGAKIHDTISPLGLRRLSKADIMHRSRVVAKIRVLFNGSFVVTSPLGKVEKQHGKYRIRTDNFQEHMLSITEKRRNASSSPMHKRRNEF